MYHTLAPLDPSLFFLTFFIFISSEAKEGSFSDVPDSEECISRIDNKPQADGAVRLWRFGNSSSEFTFGIVQVYYNLEWGNICNDEFNNNGADVICKQLGYKGSSGYHSAGDGTMYVRKNSVHCLF